MEYLSDIELYFCKTKNFEKNFFVLEGEEFKHCTKVMRNKVGYKIFATDGVGNIYEASIEEIDKDSLTAKILNVRTYHNNSENITFCIPNLKNPERSKFALEKCTELGITDFIIFNSSRTINKNVNIERLNKIVLAALKQSLRAHLPKIQFKDHLNDINKTNKKIIVFDQHGQTDLISFSFSENEEYMFVFGPEGGLTIDEKDLLNPTATLKLSDNRLRSETAIIKAASILL